MKELMYKIILTCKKATFYSSIKNFTKLSFVQQLQLKMHIVLCKGCHEFDHHSQIIDQSVQDFHQNQNLQSEEKLSEEKIYQIKTTVNKHI